MTRAELMRSLSAPPELIEAELVDQLADASAALARLRAQTPAEPDLAWDRAYARSQSSFHKALASLLNHRKAQPAPAPASAPAPAPASAPAPAPIPRDPASRANLDNRPEPARAAPPCSRPHPASASPAAPHSRLPHPIPAPRNRHERRRLQALGRPAAARHPGSAGNPPAPG
jgi:hypothetical protein